MTPRPSIPAASHRLVETEFGNPRTGDTPARQTLPEDLLREAAHRLGVVCLVSAGLWAANFLLVHLVHPMPGALESKQLARHAEWAPVFDAVGGATFLVSLALFWYTRRSRKSPRFLLDLALAYEVFIALSIGLLDYAVGTPAGISWIAIIILLFPPVIPSPPRKTLITALLAASMDPLAALFWKANGVEVPSAEVVLILAIPNYLCAAIAPLISHIITRLGREVRRAREMGSYELGTLIGQGGMGEVWQATHRFLARPAAIKLIKPDVLAAVTRMQAEVLVQRFQREARAAANLRSPHTIQLYDFGVAGDGTFYYVMELLNGLDLQTLVSQHGPLPPARAIHILQQACESLAEAHDRGLVHRDIKPANIQVCRMGHYYDFVKVLDFGLVKKAGSGTDMDVRLTAPNMVAGTPAYLSPETALGETVDQRADIYALGCVAYWMLTGRYVFEAKSPLQIVAGHLHTRPEPPSKYSAFDVGPDLEAVVLACLAKRPSDRPATARELCDRLAECEVEAVWSREDARRWWETRLEPEAAVTFSDV
jgi:tRNA A-37 threonylcarbamoyl transferase component Bud32